jgi:hypothetical protein
MLTSHGQNWHGEVHLPSSWVCPLCGNSDTTFSKPHGLAKHIVEFHKYNFPESQIDTCPLCCFPMSDEQDHRSGKADKQIPAPGKRHDEASLENNQKRIKTETGHTQSGQHSGGDPGTSSEQQGKNARAELSPSQPLSAESIARHVARHLQTIMLLTLRIISIDVEMEIPFDSNSVSARTDDHSSRVGSSWKDLDQGLGPEPPDRYQEEELKLPAIPDMSQEEAGWALVPRKGEATGLIGEDAVAEHELLHDPTLQPFIERARKYVSILIPLYLDLQSSVVSVSSFYSLT